MGHLAFGSRYCPKGPTYQESAPRTEGACGDTQAPGGHLSPTAASRAGPISDRKGGTGECGWEGRSPGWALTCPSLLAQEASQSLTMVFTVLKEEPDLQSGAESGVHSCAPHGAIYCRGPGLGCWGGGGGGEVTQQGEEESMRPEDKFRVSGELPPCPEVLPPRPLSLGQQDGPPGPCTMAYTPRLKPQVMKQGTGVSLAGECYLGLWRAESARGWQTQGSSTNSF